MPGVAKRFSPLRCEPHLRDGSTFDVTSGEARGSSGLPFAHHHCEFIAQAQTIRFAHANASTELSAVLASQFGALPAALPVTLPSGNDVRFALFVRKGTDGKGKASSDGRSSPTGGLNSGTLGSASAALGRGMGSAAQQMAEIHAAAAAASGRGAESGRGQWRVEALSGTVSESAIAALVDMHIPLPRGTVPKPKKHEQGKVEL